MATLTDAQKQTLKAHIAANTNTVIVGSVEMPINTVPNDDDHNGDVAAWYNANAAPDYNVYRSSVPMSEIMLNGFDWTRVDNLSVGKARIWDWMTSASPTRSIDPSKPNIRAGINTVWVGTAQDLAVRAAVYLHCYRPATRAEQILKASGAGTAPDQNGDGPATCGYDSTTSGKLTAANITEVRSMP